jgi:hypothetical protein
VLVVLTAEPMTMDDMAFGPGRAAAFLGAWVVMMAAMMLRAWPRSCCSTGGSTPALLAVAYLAVWAAV